MAIVAAFVGLIPLIAGLKLSRKITNRWARYATIFVAVLIALAIVGHVAGPGEAAGEAGLYMLGLAAVYSLIFERKRLVGDLLSILSILIVCALVAIVMPIVMPPDDIDKVRYGAALAQMRILEDALKRYKVDNGVFPATEQGLEALVRRPSIGVIPRNWPEGGYLGIYLDKQEVPTDPWGNPFIYISPGQHSPNYDLKSLGADGREGGDGYKVDIESWRVPR
jgi:general secretion pathway protein G